MKNTDFTKIIVRKNGKIVEKPKLKISKDFIYLMWKHGRVYWLKWTPIIIKQFDLKVNVNKKTLKFTYLGLWETDQKEYKVKKVNYRFNVQFLRQIDFMSAVNLLSKFTRKFKAISETNH